jgi:hypothetical protein
MAFIIGIGRKPSKDINQAFHIVYTFEIPLFIEEAQLLASLNQDEFKSFQSTRTLHSR